MEQSSTSYHSQGLARALRVLRALGDHDASVTLTHLSRQLSLPKSTLVRLLSVLEAEGFVRKDGEPPVFGIGDTLIEIAQTAISRDDAATLAAPLLRELADVTGFTANVGVLAASSVLHLRVEEPQRALRFRSASGSLDHLHCTGLGKMLLASLPPERRPAHLPTPPYVTFTAHTLTTWSELEDELDRIARAGYSVDQEERDIGVVCVAVPVPNEARAVCAISVAGPAGELSPAHRPDLITTLQSTAASLGTNTRFLTALRTVRDAYPLEGAP